MSNREIILQAYRQGPEAVVELMEALFERLEELRAENEALQARIKALEARLATDSHNSSKPPSSDPAPAKPKSLRPKSENKPGAQPGHKGVNLSLSEQPDHIVLHPPQQCEGCGAQLEDSEALSYERRQVVELPPLKLEVTEHRAERKQCEHCGRISQGQFPEEVGQAVQYGPRIKALGVYLLQYQLLPFERSTELFEHLFGGSLCEGTLYAAVGECSQGLVGAEAAIKQGLAESGVVHYDETGLRVCGAGWWVHVASTPSLTHLSCHPKRGKTATQQIGILPHFKGVAVHDAWDSYRSYPCRHALCNAHHLRELTWVEEQLKQSWAGELKQLLVEIKAEVERAVEAGEAGLGSEQLCELERRYLELLQQGEEHNPVQPRAEGKRGPPGRSKARRLVDRLRERRGEVLLFMYDFTVPFDNNQAERDLRMVKVKQKVSGCFRSEGGAEAYCRIRSYISTAKKQGHNILNCLERVFRGDPWIPATQR